MKKIFVLVLLAFATFSYAQNTVSVVSSDANGVTLKFSFNQYQLKPVNTTQGQAVRIEAPNSYSLLQKGAPDVLKMNAAVILPNTGNITTSVVSEKHTDISATLLVPSKGNLYRNVNPETMGYTFGKVYQQNEFFPRVQAKSNTPYIARSIRGCSVDANMVQYNPITKVLRVYSEMLVRVDFTKGQGVNELTNPKPVDAEFSAIYQRNYLNYNPAKYTAVNETGELLIICYDSYMSAMQPFVSHKLSMGIPTTMVASSTVGTTAAQIKTYISNFYSSHNLKYVLLVGDNAQIITNTITTTEGTGASDNTYGYISGNDHYPEIFVGRFSAESVANVNTMVQRSITYENNPTTGNWLSSGLGIASALGAGQGDNNEADYAHMRTIRTKLMGYTYATSVAEVYDGSQGGQDVSGDATAAQVTAAVNSGVGIINYCGHGDWNMFVSSNFTNTNVDALQNTTKWPFIFSVACVEGDFTAQTCFAEHWLRASYNGLPTGALAAVMSTINQSWQPPMKGQDEMINILTESYTSNIKRTVGGIAFNGMMGMVDAYTADGPEMIDTWTIFGDPSAMVRTADPAQLLVSHPSSTPVGTTSITVTSAVEGARVALKLNETLLGTGIISGGTATITIPTITVIDTIDVIGSAYNKIPYHGIIPINNTAAPFISLSKVLLNDVVGNNNQLADYGDTILMNVTLKNLGLANATNVSATLTLPGSYTNILNNSHSFGNIALSDSVSVAGAFRVAVSNQVPDQTTNNYTVNITDGTDNWTSYYTLLMNAPKLENQLMTINDATSSTPNNALDASENATLTIPVLNSGHANCGTTTVTLTTTSTDVTITTPTVTFTSLNASASQNASFPVVVSATAPLNSNVQFTMISRCGAYSDTTIYTTKIGAIVEDWESNSFTRYLWTNDATYPWTIVSANPQEGTYSAQSGIITDSQTSTLQISLDVAAADTISFWYKVSSESGYDFLRFYILTLKKGEWSGEVSWTRASYPITAGTKTLKWTYSKDVMESAGSDCAWIDFISLPKTVSTVGVETQATSTRYSVYPNPAKDLVNVNVLTDKAEDFTVLMLDITGKVVAEILTSVSANTPNTIQLSTAQLSSGIYFVKLNSLTTQKTIKVIVAK
jgi:uncharacterized repeat protein (TIGR01451 family)